MSAWHTLEDACYLPQQLREAKVDVYIASEGAAYTPFLAKAELTSYSILGMMSWSLPNYLSHAFRFNGKSFYIDTACSGASVALHQAKEALLRGKPIMHWLAPPICYLAMLWPDRIWGRSL